MDNELSNNQIEDKFEKVYLDPIKNFYEKQSKDLVQFSNSLIEKRLEQLNNNAKDQIDTLIKKIHANDAEIDKKAANLSIKWRKFINGIIFILFFLIIGFCFWKIYKKNKQIINEFNNFSLTKTKENNQYINQKNNLLSQVFNSISAKDIKRYILEQMGIIKVNNDNFKELLHNLQLSYFKKDNDLFFCDIEKYDVRNSFMYDVSFWNLVYTPVEYSGSRVVSYSEDGKTYTKTIVAFYSHITPFLIYDHVIVYLSNYLKDLCFVSTKDVLTQKQIKKYDKKHELILENKEIYTRYNFIYNDELQFVNFFQLITQQNFINWHDYATSHENLFNRKFEKTYKGFLVYTDKHKLDDLSLIKTNSNWFHNAIATENPKTLSIADCLYHMIIEVNDEIKEILSALSLVFSNKYLATENYINNNDFEFTYINKNEWNNKPSEVQNPLFYINKLQQNDYFYSKKYKPARDYIYENIQMSNINENTWFVNLKQSSWYIQTKEKIVVKYDINVGSVSVPVLYDDYIKFSEDKNILFSQNFKLKPNQFINSNVIIKEESLSIYETVDQNLINLVKIHNLYWNFHLENDKTLLNDTIDFIKNFNIIFRNYRNFYSIEIDSDGTFIFINEADKIPKNIKIEMLNFINNI